jgi:hypothetical protein
MDPPLSPGMREYVESVLRRKKLIPYKPYVREKHVESILGAFLTHEKNIYNLNTMICDSVHLVNPLTHQMTSLNMLRSFPLCSFICDNR